ncbi:hypothetical protein CC80DRAFT_473806 [Byssothecium circinans]|uniref:Zn(2)-C6 fungal-type domain-containing protein n=1 Tax=Byssothecium circinans TaxID=147558 RepID=A0A6A5TVV4_9PLEO|nr:hypothetical protein CC80DRAFT_473806 [Byssothecium circinans]
MAGTIAFAMQSHPGSYSDAAGGEQMPQTDPGSHASERSPPTQEKKSKSTRVRTGCLTCRDRHLKCDEAFPECLNCKKSNRECRRGLRVNFQEADKNMANWPAPYILPPGPDFQVSFQDESREIASEYKGGAEKYPPPVQRGGIAETYEYQEQYNYQHRPSYPNIGSDHSGPSGFAPAMSHSRHQSQIHHPPTASPVNTQSSASAFMAGTPNVQYVQPQREPDELPAQGTDYLQDREVVLFMQVYVEEVAIWMDSMDSKKHFSRLLPFHALGQPMLLNSFLACGARHLALVNPRYSDDKALGYYNRATKHLLDALQDPYRDTGLCATAAVILNVYEIMCERALQRMNHIAGARALIKECGWNALSTGIGAACFWLNIGMELLSCLHFNWQVAWHPDEWCLDMNMSPEQEPGREESWTYRILYITAKICNFRAAVSHNNHNHQATQRQRLAEWESLKDLADHWNECIPRTMHPVAYLHPGQTISGSAFPEIWLIKRTSIVARLFYHTCMCLLAQIHPVTGPSDPKMRAMLEEHSVLICGIAAHVKDRGVASVALRSLAIAAECLTERRAQEEVLQIIDKIRQETGWRVGFLNKELQEKWGWSDQQNQAQAQAQAQVQAQNQNQVMPPTAQQPQQVQQIQPPQQQQQQQQPQVSQQQQQQQQQQRAAALRFNPLAGVGFENPQHPYQEVYVAPSINQLIQQAQAQAQAQAHAQLHTHSNQTSQQQQQQQQPPQPHNGFYFQ